MGKKRQTPFGYGISDGKIYIDSKEAETVSRIFEQYAKGRSMLEITKLLNDDGIRFCEERPQWNKGMVKRIIDDTRYLGQKPYPRLISDDLFSRAESKKNSKTKAVVLNTMPDDIKTVYKMTYCKECGGRLTRTKDRWTCRNPECRELDYMLTDQMIVSALINILNSCIANPSLLESGGSVSEYKPSIDVMRKQNEIGMMLDSPNIDIERIKAGLYELAQLKYDCCCHDNDYCKTEQLQKLLGGREQLNTLDNGLLKICISRILVSHFCTIEAEFINGITVQNITERRNNDA